MSDPLYPSFGGHQETLEFQQKFHEERVKRIMEKYECAREDAERFIDLREEGHAVYQAAVLAGLADPNY